MADDAKVNIGVNASKAYQELEKLLAETKKIKRDIEKTPAAEVGVKFNTTKNKAQLLRQAEDLIKSVQNKMTANPVAWQVKGKIESTAAQDKANAAAAKAAAAEKIAAEKAAAAEAKRLAKEREAAEKAAAAAAVKAAKEKEAAEKALNNALNALGKSVRVSLLLRPVVNLQRKRMHIRSRLLLSKSFRILLTALTALSFLVCVTLFTTLLMLHRMFLPLLAVCLLLSFLPLQVLNLLSQLLSVLLELLELSLKACALVCLTSLPRFP